MFCLFSSILVVFSVLRPTGRVSWSRFSLSPGQYPLLFQPCKYLTISCLAWQIFLFTCIIISVFSTKTDYTCHLLWCLNTLLCTNVYRNMEFVFGFFFSLAPFLSSMKCKQFSALKSSDWIFNNIFSLARAFDVS